MAALTGTSVLLNNTTNRLGSNRAKQINSPDAPGSLIPIRATNYTTSAAAADTINLTTLSTTYAVRVGFMSSTGTATLIIFNHGGTTTGANGDGAAASSLGFPAIAAGGGLDTGIIPVVPGAVVGLGFTTAVAASTVTVYEYGYRTVEANTTV